MKHHIHRNCKNSRKNEHSERFTYISIPVNLTVETIRCSIGFFLRMKHLGWDIVRTKTMIYYISQQSLHWHGLCCTHRFVFVWWSTERNESTCSDFRHMTEWYRYIYTHKTYFKLTKFNGHEVNIMWLCDPSQSLLYMHNEYTFLCLCQAWKYAVV